jgi:hypothetical protein
MHEPTFRQAISHSWQLVIQKKSLWIFGLLSAAIGQWGLSDFMGLVYKTANEGFRIWNLGIVIDFFRAWNWHKVSVILLMLWLLGIILLIIVSLVFVAVSARGAVIAYAIHWYKTEKIMPLHEAWNKGMTRFFPIFTVTIAGRFLQILIAFLFSLISVRIIEDNTVRENLLIILSATVAIFLALLIEATVIYTSGYLILEKKGTVQSLKKGWGLLSHHLMVSLELGLILMLFTALLLGILVYGSFVAFLPSLVILVVAGFTGFKFLIGLAVYSGLAFYSALVLVTAGIFNAFVTCAWMYLFMKMHHEGVVSRSVHFLKKLFKIS